jgi:hypothetical protein
MNPELRRWFERRFTWYAFWCAFVLICSIISLLFQATLDRWGPRPSVHTSSAVTQPTPLSSRHRRRRPPRRHPLRGRHDAGQGGKK